MPAASLGIAIEKGVGSRIIDLPGKADIGADRREQHDEFGLPVGEHFLENQRAAQLWCQNGGGGAGFLQLRNAIVDHPGGVEDPIDGTKADAGLLHGMAHLGKVADIGAEHHDFAAKLFDGLDLPDAIGNVVVGIEPERAPRPFLARGQPAAADQHQAGGNRFGEMTGKGKADTAKTAGDQVDTAEAQGVRPTAARASRIDDQSCSQRSPVR